MAKRKLGEFIEQTDIRNSNNKFGENELRGLSVYKSFIKTHANLNGVTFGNYKVIYPNDFVYIPDTSRRGDKIAIAKNDNDNCLIVSNVYTSFKVINENELNPDYLMLIFKNSEFDRYARYNSWGSAREVFSWEDFCNTEIDVPSIQEQEKIVQRYKVVTDRIEILNKINKNLQDTAQALYKHWFVDFEFPNKEGKPYKSSGGKMVCSKELDKEIPEGWEVASLANNSLCSLISSGINKFDGNKNYLATANIDIENIVDGDDITYKNRPSRANMQPSLNSIWFAKMKETCKHIAIPENGAWFVDKYILSTGFEGLKCTTSGFPFLYSFVCTQSFEEIKDIKSHGTTQQAINDEDLKTIYFVVPNNYLLNRYSIICNPILLKRFNIIKEIKALSSLKDRILPTF